MASTDPAGAGDGGGGGEAPPVRLLTIADLPGALALSASAHWNQNEADWRDMLRLGVGVGIEAAGDDAAAKLAASAVVLPYGERFAWVSMVLVLPEFRRRGYASLLLRHVLGRLAAQGRAGILDATPAGHAVYVQEGFRDTWGFARYRREARPREAAREALPARSAINAPRPLAETDWPGIAALDAPAFGADRLPLLRSLARRRPQAAWVIDDQAGGAGRLRGFVLGRDGREAVQIGPLVAGDAATAQDLLGAALAAHDGPVYVDLLDGREQLQRWIGERGFTFQRPFTRMVCGGPAVAPGDPVQVQLVAGPELG